MLDKDFAMQTITSTGMSVDRFVLNTFSQGEFLKATMKRYRPSSVDRLPQDPGYILIFMHGIGFRKSHSQLLYRLVPLYFYL